VTREKWEVVKDLFQRVQARQAGKRTALLAELCGSDAELRVEVESLLHNFEQAGEFMKIPAVGDAVAARPAADATMEGLRIGQYVLIRLIGQGGMGAIYLASRADEEFRKRVAVKLVQPGLNNEEILRRFRTERQTLAVLDHPNIVKLIDSGTTGDGVPYLVMDYVEGQPIDIYCRRRNLTVNERLELFRIVCSAVHYAHQNLIVHRDLKPSNILVTAAGAPKLLDFGIAKLLKPEMYAWNFDLTRTGLRLMTPRYASPEQIRGEPITTATDVYSLGVILYELLTGRYPYHLKTENDSEIEQAVCLIEPEKPSTAAGRRDGLPVAEPSTETMEAAEMPHVSHDRNPEKLRKRLIGDLDMILLTALRKEPQRRYASVEQFSEDIRRHLAGLPVIARKDTLGYRTAKFVARHKWGVAAASALILMMLVGAAGTSWEAHQALVEKTRAERRFNDVRKLATALLFDLDPALRNLTGSTQARKLVVERVLASLSSLAREAGNDPALQRELAAAFQRAGEIQWARFYSNLGDLSGAMASQRAALSSRQALLTARPADPAARSDVGWSYWEIGDLMAANNDTTKALDMYKKSLAVWRRLAVEQPDDDETGKALALPSHSCRQKSIVRASSAIK
jgi:serine/threonine protein kinase